MEQDVVMYLATLLANLNDRLRSERDQRLELEKRLIWADEVLHTIGAKHGIRHTGNRDQWLKDIREAVANG